MCAEASRFEVAVVIATKNRSAELANRSLRSIVEQTRLPDHLIVVDDSDRRYRSGNRRIVASANVPGARVMYRENDRTPGASGAWNVALDSLHRIVPNPKNVLVAFLDDDDRWSPGYLEACVRFAQANGCDMVGTDILRVEQLGEAPIRIAAPVALLADDFLVGNPGIQGSNLFVRLSVLLEAGLFDEALPSTTDRDLCIRIADLGGVRYGHLTEPLVEHFAEPSRDRLSRRGSESKLRGLTAFWRKWSGRMTSEQRDAFQERAHALFGWVEDRARIAVATEGGPREEEPASKAPVALVVGIIADVSRPDALTGVVGDLLALQDDPRVVSLDVVLLENGHRLADSKPLQEASSMLLDAGAGCYVVPIERQAEDARAGLFGTPFDLQPGRATIAVARTMLQTYAYVVAKPRTGAIVWILDGDCRLDNLVWDGARIVKRQDDLIGALIRLRSAGVDIAIGTVSDAPPVPFASCIRTQLVDAYHNLECMAALDPDAAWPDRHEENMAIREACEDYYYDLSRRDTDHLETPFWYATGRPDASVREAFREMVARLPRMFAGEQVFRPLIYDGRCDPLSQMQPSVHRGGNTFVLDVEALRDFPNAAPRVDGTEARRSDMVWSLLNRYVARRTVMKLPLAVRQDRGEEPVGALDWEKLGRDIVGYALYSALEDVLLDRDEGARRGDGQALPGLADIEETHLESRMRKYLRERLAAFSLSFHRAAGLGRLLERYVSAPGAPWWLADPSCAESVADLRRFVDRVQREYDLSRLHEFVRDLKSVDTATVVRGFLDQLRDDLEARERGDDAVRDATRWVQKQRASIAKHRVECEFGVDGLRTLGHGAEAVVLTDGRTVFKVVDYWKTRMPYRQLEFLRGQVGLWEGVPGLYAIREIRTSASWVVITYDYEPSEPYDGGRAADLIRLLQGCRRAGIVCNNIHPANLVVTAEGVKLVDYGSDIRPFTPELFEHMARRAYLSCHHADREDLKVIMRRALNEHDLPDLDGFERFRAALEPVSKEQLVDAWVATALGDGEGRRLLDYGCGKGKLAERLAGHGWTVTAYDPDPALEATWPSSNGRVEFGRGELLSRLRGSDEKFDVVVCSLVLCLLDDDDFRDVLADLSRFAAEGSEVVVVVCNPKHVHGTTQIQRRHPPEGARPGDVFRLEKHVFSTGARIVDVHRPVGMYVELFAEHGLDVVTVHETPGVDLDTLEPTSDFMIFRLRRVARKESADDVRS